MSATSKVLTAVALAAALVAGGADDARAESRARRPAAGTPLEPAELGWSSRVQSLQARSRTDVYRTPGKTYVGALAKGTRVAWTKIVADRGRCKAWVEIQPRGWVCAADLVPTDLPPAGAIDPQGVAERSLAREHAGVVPRGADAFATKVDVEKNTPWKQAPGWAFLRDDTEIVRIAGRRYYRTRFGYIAAKDVEPRQASTFAGVTLTATTPWPLAWTLPARRDLPVIVRAAPDARAAQVATLPRREVLPVLEQRGGFARVGADRWIALDELRLARTSPRPDGVRADERWIDVDLDQQVLVAYEGDRPVFTTLVSTGIGRSTPTALHRIADKRMVTRMKSPDVAPGRWDMPDVPFAMTFREHYALHGVYWHDSFGRKRSHGCINVSPRDGAFLFTFASPHLPDGWIQGESDGDTGTPIRIRSSRDPDPDWTPFDAPPPVPLRSLEPTDG